MKTQLQLFIIFLLFAVYGANGQCPSGSITFNNQTDIDNFIINYPNCEEIDGGLVIIGNDITNLNGLSNITSVTGVLEVLQTNLTSLEGLNSLITIGGDYLMINMNYQLTSLNGLNSLTSLSEGYLGISANPLLINLEGLESLTQVHSIDIQNTSLTDLNGLSGLTTIGMEFWPGLLEIRNNNALTDITGLQNISPNFLAVINIENNPLLSYCHLSNFCEYLSNPTDTHPRSIFGNLEECESDTTILAECALSTDDFLPENNWLVYKQDNQFEIQTKGFELKEVTVYDMLGRKVYQNKANATSHTISDIASNGLLIIKITTSENKILTKKVIK